MGIDEKQPKKNIGSEKLMINLIILEKNEKGEKFWKGYNTSYTEGYQFSHSKSLEFNPNAFSLGTSIEVFQSLENKDL